MESQTQQANPTGKSHVFWVFFQIVDVAEARPVSR
jgi:hypothetical protein